MRTLLRRCFAVAILPDTMSKQKSTFTDFTPHFQVIFFACLFFLPGLVILSEGLCSAYEGRSSGSWPKVPGVITHSIFHEYSTYPSSSRKYSPRYSAQIQYTYLWLGQTMNGDRIQTSISSTDKEVAYEQSIKYPEGKKVDVFVNPENPKAAVLEPGMVQTQLNSVFVGLFLIGAGLCLLFYVRSIRR